MGIIGRGGSGAQVSKAVEIGNDELCSAKGSLAVVEPAAINATQYGNIDVF